MKCSHCGFPLSPSRISCPRCGASTNAKEQFSSSAWVPHGTPVQQTPFGGQDARFGASQVDNAPQNQQPVWHTSSSTREVEASAIPEGIVPSSFPSGEGGSYGQYGQSNYYGNAPEQVPDRLYLAPTSASEPLSMTPLSPRPPVSPRKSHSPSLAFTVAGLCIISGALLLVFVYFFSIGLLNSSSRQNSSSAPTTSARVPTVALSPTPVISPTPTFPGQQYITNGQLASEVNTSTAQPITLATTFQAGRRIYVTFEVHTPNNGSGGVCLLWYLNNSLFSTYAFPVDSSTSAYSYTRTGSTGSGTVEIYWTLLASCGDPNKVLGDRLSFTVTA
jgi:hypothetical protein